MNCVVMREKEGGRDVDGTNVRMTAMGNDDICPNQIHKRYSETGFPERILTPIQ